MRLDERIDDEKANGVLRIWAMQASTSGCRITGSLRSAANSSGRSAPEFSASATTDIRETNRIMLQNSAQPPFELVGHRPRHCRSTSLTDSCTGSPVRSRPVAICHGAGDAMVDLPTPAGATSRLR